MRVDAVEIEVLVAGRVVALEVFQLPGLAGEPSVDPRLDGAEVGANKDMPRLGAQRCPRELGRDAERIAKAGELGVVAGDERVDQAGGILGVVAAEIVQLRSRARPPTGGAAID